MPAMATGCESRKLTKRSTEKAMLWLTFKDRDEDDRYHALNKHEIWAEAELIGR